jgi:GAF domain-containing protein
LLQQQAQRLGSLGTSQVVLSLDDGSRCLFDASMAVVSAVGDRERFPSEGVARELVQLLFSEQSRDETLGAIARVANAALADCIAASITLSDRGRPHTVVSSAELAEVLDEQQYATGEGPCLDALRGRELVTVGSIVDEQRWPHFTPAVQRSVVKSITSFPLIAGSDSVGALNLYSDVPRGLEETREAAQTFARMAAITVANALAYHRANELGSQLTEALDHRDVIGQAKGMLMARDGLTADQAFDRLRVESQHANRKLYEVAPDIGASESGSNRSE